VALFLICVVVEPRLVKHFIAEFNHHSDEDDAVFVQSATAQLDERICDITYDVAQSLSVRSQREADLALAVLKAVRHCEQQMALWDYTLRISIKARKHVTIRPEFQFGEPLNISPVD